MGYKIKNKMWREKILVHVHVRYTNRMFESKDGTTSMKYLIRLKEA